MKSEVVTDNKMINRLKVVLAEKNRTGKWLAQIGRASCRERV